MCKDNARFEGVLHDFDSDRGYFTLRTAKQGILGFPFADVVTMDPA
jgi:hypothetical protein